MDVNDDVKIIFEKVMEGKILSSQEAKAIMLVIAEGRFSEVKTAGLLAGLRVRGETAEEIIGFAKAMQEKAVQYSLNKPYPVLLDTCGTGGDGLQTLNISTIVAVLLASAGIPVAKHGNRSVSSSCGSADVLEELGVDINMQASRSALCLEEVGVSFLFAPVYHPAMKHVVPVRKAMATRTLFNVLGPLANPAPVTHQLVGVFSKKVQPLMAKALLGLQLKAFAVVYAEDGMDELSLVAPTKIIGKRTSEKHLYEETIIATQHGFKDCTKEELFSDLKISNPKEGAKRMKNVLMGSESGAASSTALLNAAMALTLVEKVSSLAEGRELANSLIKTGKAAETLQRWVNFN